MHRNVLLCTLLLLVWGTNRLTAQSSKGAVQVQGSASQGNLTYILAYPDSVAGHASADQALPKTIHILWKKDDYRAEVFSEQTVSLSIGNLKQRAQRTFLSLGAQHFELQANLDTLYQRAFRRAPFYLEYGPDHILIHGLVCRQVTIHYRNETIRPAQIYYAPALPNIPCALTFAFSKIPGLIVKMTTEFQGIRLAMDLVSFEEALADDSFVPPQGFTQMQEHEALDKLSTASDLIKQ